MIVQRKVQLWEFFMSFIEIMHTYFKGEKLEAIFYILPIGALLIAIGITALKAERGGFAWGIAVPTLLFGIVLVGTGIGIGIRTNSQVNALEKAYSENSYNMAEKELQRMETVNKNFRITFIAFGCVAAAGLLVHYLGGTDWGRGLGATLILIAALGLLIDGFAERRAVPYTKALQEIVDNRIK